MKSRIVHWIALLLSVSLPAGASLFYALSQDELIARSDAVVVCRVLATHSFWNPEGTMVLTEARVHVDESIFGNSPAEVSVRTLGGEINGYTFGVVGEPRFAPGDRMLLFLTHKGDGPAQVVGFEQGQYAIVADRGGAELAVPKAEVHDLVSRAGRSVSPPRTLRLDTLKQQIRDRAAWVNRHER